MRYKPRTVEADEVKVGDVRRFNLNEGGEMSTFIAVIVGMDCENVRVRRCYKEDPKSGRYQIKDVGAAGLEYAMFVDDKVWRMSRKTIGRKYGMLSKKDLRNVKE